MIRFESGAASSLLAVLQVPWAFPWVPGVGGPASLHEVRRLPRAHAVRGLSRGRSRIRRRSWRRCSPDLSLQERPSDALAVDR